MRTSSVDGPQAFIRKENQEKDVKDEKDAWPGGVSTPSSQMNTQPYVDEAGPPPLM